MYQDRIAQMVCDRIPEESIRFSMNDNCTPSFSTRHKVTEWLGVCGIRFGDDMYEDIKERVYVLLEEKLKRYGYKQMLR